MNLKNNFDNFELFTHRRHLARFICRYELFKKILNTEGSIIECGVYNGSGILSFAKLSEIFEPYSIKRKIIGFDSFEGFLDTKNKKDQNIKRKNPLLKKNKFKVDDKKFKAINRAIKEFNKERYLDQFQKVELVKGDAVKTIPKYLKENKHLIVALLFIDFDLYKPCKVALKNFLPRMANGSILAFDEINNSGWPGETSALIEELSDLRKVKIEKFHFDSNISYIIL